MFEMGRSGRELALQWAEEERCVQRLVVTLKIENAVTLQDIKAQRMSKMP